MTTVMNAAMAAHDDVMDIDIDMDLGDVPAEPEDQILEDGEHEQQLASQQDTTGMVAEIYNEDPMKEPQHQKLHLRGVDELHTNDILSWAKEYFSSSEPHIQWVDDTSANLVFQDAATARSALLALVEIPTTPEEVLDAPFELRRAKTLSSRPTTVLEVRVAQVGDRKRKNAREASRYYLLHPEEDPGERMRGEFAKTRADNGDYRRRRFDHNELRRRRDHDRDDGGIDFSANMYDDTPSEQQAPSTTMSRGRDLFERISNSRPRRRSASPGGQHSDSADSEPDGRVHRRQKRGYRDRSNPPPYSRHDPNAHLKANMGKELFSSPSFLSSSGMRSDAMDVSQSSRDSHHNQSSMSATNSTDHRQSNTAAAKRLKADLLASMNSSSSQARQNPASMSPRSNGHRRSHAMDAKNDEDLVERFGRKSLSADSTKSIFKATPNSGLELFPLSGSAGGSAGGMGGGGGGGGGGGWNGGLNIKGAGGFSIKGRATGDTVKELFPEQYSHGGAGGGTGAGANSGKELFDQPVRERRDRRRAGDLFD